jgi:hypothetical protein
MKRMIAGIAVGIAALVTTSLLAVPTSQAAAKRWTIECVFTEPFGSLRVSPSQVLWLDTEHPNLAPLSNGRASLAKGSMNVSGTRPNGEELRGIVKNEPGNIGESDFTTDWTLESNMTNNSSAGCLRYSDGMEFREVTGVAAGDVLYVRATASPKGKSLGSYESGAVITVDPQQRKGDWIRADVANFGASEGPVRIARGWVNSRFVSKTRIG